MPINFVSVINKSKSLNYLFHQTNYAGALRCDNQYRGTLNFNNHKYTQNRSPINRSIQKNNCLIVIGESPHTSEYNF